MVCLYVRDTPIAVPDWALGGHLVMSACVRVSAECEWLRLWAYITGPKIASTELLGELVHKHEQIPRKELLISRLRNT